MCLERLSIMDDPSSPLELGDGEGDESEDSMYLSEAREDLLRAIDTWKGKDADMSRLKAKNGYHAGESVEVEPVEWSIAQVGYLTEVSVTYKTGNDQLTRDHVQVPENYVAQTLEEMLGRKSISYPE